MGQIRDLVVSSHANAVRKGFYDDVNNVISFLEDELGADSGMTSAVKDAFVSQRLMLTTSELGEGLESIRKKKRSKESLMPGVDFKVEFEEYVKDTLEDELADAAIRLFDLCGWLGIDLENHILMKARYNSDREKMHGGKSF